MIPQLQCAVELLEDPVEETWMVSIDHADVSAMILLLNGLIFHKIPKITFADKKTSRTVILSAEQGDAYVLQLDDRSVAATKIWMEAILSMLLDVQFEGWGEDAHLDAEFRDRQGAVSVTFSVSFF